MPARMPAPEGRRLEDGRDLDRATHGVGQGLDEDLVGAHAAVDPERGERVAGVDLGRIDEVAAPLGDPLEDGAGDLRSA